MASPKAITGPCRCCSLLSPHPSHGSPGSLGRAAVGDTKRGPGRWRTRGWDSPSCRCGNRWEGKQQWGVMGGCVEWRGVMGRLRRQGCADITPGRWRRGKGSGKGRARETAEGRDLHREWAPGRGKRHSGGSGSGWAPRAAAGSEPASASFWLMC